MREFNNLKAEDEEVYNIVVKEHDRQQNHLEMIASENLASEAVMETAGSYHILKYSEGYASNHKFGKPGRYYAGCENIDSGEELAIERCCKLFNCKYANVQPHSGAQANMAVQFALLNPGDTIMGMSLNSGGHLTHGAKPTFSGKNYKSVQYEVNPETMEIDYDEIPKLLDEHNPRLFIAGASAYPRAIDFERIRNSIDLHNKRIYQWVVTDSEAQGDEISKTYEKMKCYFMVDMAHIAGLVATGLHQSPIPYADVVTSTTHKTLRGPRGGIILTNNEEIANKIDKAVFPGIQGGPLENMILAKAVAFGEALKPEFKEYQKQVIKNIKVFEKVFKENKINMITGGTDNHLILLDLRDKNITGAELENKLAEIGIITNKNAVPFDTKNKKETSGLRLGTPAITTRGLKEDDCKVIAEIISDIINKIVDLDIEDNKISLQNIVKQICEKYPIY